MSSANGFAVGDLSEVARAVGGGADDLGGMPAPDLPDAGASSASVAGVLGSMSSVISNVVRTAASARQRVAVNQQSYQEIDQAVRSAFTLDDGGLQ